MLLVCLWSAVVRSLRFQKSVICHSATSLSAVMLLSSVLGKQYADISQQRLQLSLVLLLLLVMLLLLLSMLALVLTCRRTHVINST